MKKLAQMECYRLLHTPRLIALLLGLIVASILGTCTHVSTSMDSMAQFYGILGDERYLGFFATLIGAYYYCMDYQNRTYSPAVCRGYGRGQIYAAKLVGYLLLTTVISTVSALLSVLITVENLRSLDAGLVAGKLALRVCFDLRIWAVPPVLAHLFRKLVPAILAGFACGFLFLTSSSSNITRLLSAEQRWLFAVGSLALMVAAAWIGYALFRRVDLK